jgi:hypothetical protein
VEMPNGDLQAGLCEHRIIEFNQKISGGKAGGFPLCLDG